MAVAMISFCTPELLALTEAAVANERLDPDDLEYYRRYRELGEEYDRHAGAGNTDKAQSTFDDLA
jgi:hypothetical protein